MEKQGLPHSSSSGLRVEGPWTERSKLSQYSRHILTNSLLLYFDHILTFFPFCPYHPQLWWQCYPGKFSTDKNFAIAGMVAHPVTQVIGEQALVDILDQSEVAWTCWGCFYTQQWAGAEDGEGIRPAAGTGNE